MPGNSSDETQQHQSDAIEELKKINKYIEEKPKRDRIARVERIQLAVALAVMTGYLTIYTYSGVKFAGSARTCLTGPSGFHCAASLQALYAGTFLTIKLTTMSIRPVYSGKHECIRLIDDYVLTASYIPLVPFSLLAGYGVLTAPEWEFMLFTEIYMGVELVLIYALGTSYARDYKSTMDQLRTSTTSNTVSIASNSHDDITRMNITNDTGDILSEGEIRFIVDSPSDIETRLEQTYPVDGDTLVYAHDLGPESSINIPVHVGMNETESNLEEESIHIYVQIDGNIEAEEIIGVYG